MRRSLLLFFSIILIGSAFAQTLKQTKKGNRHYRKVLKRTEKSLLWDLKNAPSKKDDEVTPGLWWLQQYMLTMDPALGYPTPEVLVPVLEALNAQPDNSRSLMPGTSGTSWVERGPNNVGGRTRGLAWDPTDGTNKKVWAGGVSGGLWYNTDITSSSSSWIQVSTLWANLAVTAIAFDPINKGTMYVGTGEGYGASSSATRGFGIWKSTDSGKTFSQLSSTTGFFYVNDIAVRNESGSSVVYTAVDWNYYGGSFHGTGTYGIQRSTNGGTGWTNVSPNVPSTTNKFAVADLEIGADNRLWAGTRIHPFSATDRGGGRVLYSDNGTSWSISHSHSDITGRVEIACAPNSPYVLYGIFESAGTVNAIKKTGNRGSSWSGVNEPQDADLGIPSTDFARGQAWYDLILAVDPNDSNTVIAGAIDLFRSTNSGTSWSQISKWSNNPNLNTLSCPLVHADQHNFLFRSGSSSVAILSNDGGVYYGTNIPGAATSSTAIVARVKDYNTVQFYWGEIAETSGSNNILGGSQDNGTQKFTAAGMNSTTQVRSGDGAYCFIDKGNSNKQIASYVYNQYYYTLSNWVSEGTLISDISSSNGSFINPAEWDENGPGLFSNKRAGNLYRITLTTSPGSLQTITYGGVSGQVATAIKAFKLSNGKTRLWVGNDLGDVYQTDDAWAGTPAFSDKTGSINNGSISDIFNWNSSDTVFVTLSNYGINNIYMSTNQGSSWTAKDGNLPNMPVWSLVINPNKSSEAVIATEVGVFGTTNIYAGSPVWTALTDGMGAVKVSTLKLRETDKMLLAVTHGRGMFTSDAFSKVSPVSKFKASSLTACTNQNITFTDTSDNYPTGWTWRFNPGTVTFKNGTDSNSQNPVVRFNAGGSYAVTLITSNAFGIGTVTKTAYITVTDTIPGKSILISDKNPICAGDSVTLTATVDLALDGSITSYVWKNNNILIPGSGNQASINQMPLPGNSYTATLTSNKFCVSPTIFTSNAVQITVDALIYPKLSLALDPNPVCTPGPVTATITATNAGSSPVYEWFLNGNLQSGSASTFVITSPVHGDKIWARSTIAGACIRPQNQIYSDTETVIISSKPPAPVISHNWDTLTASNVGSGTYSWYNQSGTLFGTGRIIQANQNGTFRVVYRENGCNSDSSNALVFNSLDAYRPGMPFIQAYPNPAKDVCHLPASETIRTLRVYELSGREVKAPWQLKSGQVVVDLRSLPTGSYLIFAHAQNGKSAYRVTKQ